MRVRTTVDIPDAQYRKLKAKAAHEGKTIKALVHEGVEHVLTSPSAPRFKKIDLPIIRSKKPGSMILNNHNLYDHIDFP